MAKSLESTDIKSLFVLAPLDGGNYYPCLIIGISNTIKNGFKLYFFRQDIEIDLESNLIIHDLNVLKNLNVCCIENMAVKRGKLISFDSTTYSNTPIGAVIYTNKKMVWVPFPRIMLTKDNAREIGYM